MSHREQQLRYNEQQLSDIAYYHGWDSVEQGADGLLWARDVLYETTRLVTQNQIDQALKFAAVFGA